MPIRFRCAYCSQLMGIARRKAGTIVNCPKCQGQVIVPNPEGEEESVQTDSENKQENVFEQDDFDNVLQPAPVTAPTPMPGPGPAPQPAAPPNAGGQVAIKEPPARTTAPVWTGLPQQADAGLLPRGLFLTPGLLTLISVLVVLLLGLAFFLGLLLGKSSTP